MTKRALCLALSIASSIAACGDDDGVEEADASSDADAAVDAAPDDADDRDTSEPIDGSETDANDLDATDASDANTDPDHARPLDDDGEVVSGTVDGDQQHFFSVPYVPNQYGLILTTSDGTATVSFHRTLFGGDAMDGVNACTAEAPNRCGKALDFSYLEGATPETATIVVRGDGEYQLELVELAGPVEPESIPLGAVRVKTLREVDEEGGEPSIGSDQRTMVAERGPGNAAVYFPLLSENRALCWIRPTNDESGISETVGMVRYTAPTSDFGMAVSTAGGSFPNLDVTPSPGAAFLSGEATTIDVNYSGGGDPEVNLTAPGLADPRSSVSIVEGALVHGFESVSGRQSWYLRFAADSRLVECRADITDATDTFDALDAAVLKDLFARGIVPGDVEVGVCSGLVTVVGFGPGEVSTEFRLCDSLKVLAPLTETLTF